MLLAQGGRAGAKRPISGDSRSQERLALAAARVTPPTR